MKAVEFTTELNGESLVRVPREIAAQLPKGGRVRVIILAPKDPEESEWWLGGYGQFLHEDPPEDSVYDNLR